MQVSVDLSVLMPQEEWEECQAEMPERLRIAGFRPVNIFASVVCPSPPTDGPLVQEYELGTGTQAGNTPLWRVIVNGDTTVPLPKVAPMVAECLPPTATWLGSVEIGHTEFAWSAEPVWSAESSEEN
ncbi:hypothetical protein GWO53_06000 [Corynebacterium macginleyi]|uniref:Uncharacterized protein n=1 Tax=Corynebacterium macginleyi TaxID=38290 RepID=A0A3M0GRD7_9CORY|nr:hypothetical protein [Corynebacterium macginleyi]MBK4140024.1 hypothetical protein [Corynebacterium macginleyi]MBK4146079.1 hypothetical protein [Corynebacterium macginleyi]MBK4157243.1 hypothetical protein [Corynebacterium macginleyi]RMB64273.1 hypothetical protein D9543_00325 [Corynebacterium macginleyi]